jgi:integrase/recombinase XerD
VKRATAVKQRAERARSVAALDRSVDDGFSMWIPRHLDWMRMRNYSTHTVDNREQWLVVFALWCAARGISRPREVTKPILERYRRQLYEHRKPNGKPLTFGSQIGRLAPLKLFFAWMTRQNALLWNPASELDLPKLEKRLPRALTIAEIEAVLAQPEVAEPVGLRDRAILELLYSTGMRRSELAALKLADFAADHGTVFIRQGKGKRDRVVPVGERAIAWVEKYLLDVRPGFVVDAVEDALFLSETGAPIEPDTLTHRVGWYVEGANLGKRGSCHLFRHTMATHMLEGGADVRFIQEMLGHASLETTEIYTRVSIMALRAVHAATHPAARLKGGGGALPPRAEDPGGAREELSSALENELGEEEAAEARSER